MRKAGRVVAETLREMKRSVRTGMSTAELDAVGAAVFRKHGARSAPQLVYKFPGVCCISLNDEAVHGIPGDRKLEPGDLLKIDVTAELDGYIADAAITVPVEPADEHAIELAACARKAFYRAIDSVRAGRQMRDWGRLVEAEVNGEGFSVLKELFGHGVGRTIHEAPRNVPNYDEPHIHERFVEGTVVAMEPIISVSSEKVKTDPDGWTLRTKDGSLAAHFEHTVIVTKGKPMLLTAA